MRVFGDVGREDEANKINDSRPIVFDTSLEKITHANVLAKLGRHDEAGTILTDLIDERVAVDESLYELSLLGGKHWTKEHKDLADARLAHYVKLGRGSVALCFAAGRIADYEKRFDDAFKHYKAGNDLSENTFDIDAYRKLADRIMGVFEPDQLRNKSRYGISSDVPVFVVELPRSGKTTLERALSQHPEIFGAGEIGLQTIVEGGIIVGLDQDLDNEYEDRVRGLQPDEARMQAESYLEEIVRYSRSSKYILNTLPLNFQNVGVLHMLFPRAKFIHMRRNSIDTCLFCFTKKPRNAHSYTDNLRIMGDYYTEYRRQMSHWNGMIPDHIFDVYYEDLVKEPRSVLVGICDFLGLGYDDEFASRRPMAGVTSLESGKDEAPLKGTSKNPCSEP